jgi:two-component system sensor histidine kinase ResE
VSNLAGLSEELEEARREARRRDEFLAAVTHEFRTPLTAIRSFAEILLARPPEDPEEQREYVGVILDEALRLTRLVNDLSDYTRMRSGGMDWMFRDCSLPDAVERAVRATSVVAGERDLEVRVGVEGEIPPFSFDRDRIIQVVVNLLTNAIKHSPRGGTVTATVRAAEGRAGVTVRDEGPGVPEQHRERVFDRYRQLGGPEARRSGSGLGLSIAREIVRSHRGEIGVRGAPEGGAEFYFELPMEPDRRKVAVTSAREE